MKTLFITGGRGDIGHAIIDKFKQQHYQIIAPDSSCLNLDHLNDIEGYSSTLPTIDAFIHCAGINRPQPFIDLDVENMEKTLTINALSFYKIAHSLLNQNKLNENGHILGISSIYGEVSRQGRFAYTAAKYCMNGMIKNLSLELGKKHIKVNGLAPGFVDTTLTRKNNSLDIIARLENAIPLGRLASTEDIAKAAFFFASEENSYINGQIIVADGGYLAGGFQE